MGMFDRYMEETQRNYQKALAGDINVGQLGLRGLASGIRLGSEATGEVLSTVGDMITPDFLGVGETFEEYVTKPLAEAVQKGLQTDTGKEIVKFTQENPELWEDMKALGLVGSVVPLARAGNAVAFNMPTKVPGFYSGDPLLKFMGVLESSSEGAKNALATAFNPTKLALEREYGISEGFLKQARDTQALIPEYENVDQLYRSLKARKKEGNLSAEESQLLKSVSQRRAELAKEGTYNQGALAYAWLFKSQKGDKIPEFLRKTFQDRNILGFSKAPNKQEFDNLVWGQADNLDVSSAQKELTRNHILKAWGLENNKDTIVVVKHPDVQHRATNEMKTKSNAKAFWTLNSRGLDIRNMEPSQVIQAFQGHSLTQAERGIIDKFKSGKQLTDTQQKTYNDAMRKLKNEKKLTWDEDSQLYVMRDSYKSAAKELGGVNRLITMDRKGNVTITVSDRHDMMGIDPAFGKPLVTVFPPYKYNAYSAARGETQYTPKATSEEAKDYMAKVSGAQEPQKAGVYTSTADRMVDEAAMAIAGRGVKPTARDYGRAAYNVGSTGYAVAPTVGGMLTGEKQEGP
jgi:hypothetical protein